jgi:hypothetical protein
MACEAICVSCEHRLQMQNRDGTSIGSQFFVPSKSTNYRGIVALTGKAQGQGRGCIVLYRRTDLQRGVEVSHFTLDRWVVKYSDDPLEGFRIGVREMRKACGAGQGGRSAVWRVTPATSNAAMRRKPLVTLAAPVHQFEIPLVAGKFLKRDHSRPVTAPAHQPCLSI